MFKVHEIFSPRTSFFRIVFPVDSKMNACGPTLNISVDNLCSNKLL